jgi:hypothetical protein
MSRRPLPRDVDNPAAARGARQATAAVRRRLAELAVHGADGRSTGIDRTTARRSAVGSAARPTRISTGSGTGSAGRAARPRAAATRPAQPVRASRRHDARRARAAVGGCRARTTTLDALLAVTDERRRRASNRVGYAGDPSAAVRARSAGPALGHARSRGASRYAHVVLVASVLRFTVSRAAIARRAAGHRGELADVTVGLAAHRQAADSNRIRRRDNARDRLARATR